MDIGTVEPVLSPAPGSVVCEPSIPNPVHGVNVSPSDSSPCRYKVAPDA